MPLFRFPATRDYDARLLDVPSIKGGPKEKEELMVDAVAEILVKVTSKEDTIGLLKVAQERMMTVDLDFRDKSEMHPTIRNAIGTVKVDGSNVRLDTNGGVMALEAADITGIRVRDLNPENALALADAAGKTQAITMVWDKEGNWMKGRIKVDGPVIKRVGQTTK